MYYGRSFARERRTVGIARAWFSFRACVCEKVGERGNGERPATEGDWGEERERVGNWIRRFMAAVDGRKEKGKRVAEGRSESFSFVAEERRK